VTSPPSRSTLVAFVLTFVVAPAAAAPPPTIPAAAPAEGGTLADRLPEDARAEYTAGRVLHGEKDFEGAQIKFQRAYELSREPRLLWNVAACHKALRRYAEARRVLQRYRDEAAGTLTAEEAERVDTLVKNLAAFVSSVRLVVSEPGAEVLVDGTVVATVPPRGDAPTSSVGPLFVDLGERRLVVRKPGFREHAETLVVKGGEDLSREVVLRPETRRGRLVVSTSASATVVVDGVSRGSGRVELELPSGVHTVRISEVDKRTFAMDVLVEDGKTRTVDAPLEDEDGGGLPAWLWVAGGVAIAGGAVTAVVLATSGGSTVEPIDGSLGSVRLPSGLGVRFW
jgi:hypothetical protein